MFNKVRCATVLGLCMLAGCATSTYHTAGVSHMYTTDTQRHHDLSSIELWFEVPGVASVFDKGEQFLGLAPVKVYWYLDSRRVAAHNASSSYRADIQLPPGNHELFVECVEQGLATVGSKKVHFRKRADFTLKRGERLRYKIESSNAPITSPRKFNVIGWEDR